jgi:hypothetical protein
MPAPSTHTCIKTFVVDSMNPLYVARARLNNAEFAHGHDLRLCLYRAQGAVLGKP